MFNKSNWVNGDGTKKRACLKKLMHGGICDGSQFGWCQQEKLNGSHFSSSFSATCSAYSTN
jgi:hypothetical protein